MALKNWVKYGALVGINLLYACVTIFTKFASQQEMLSLKYLIGLSGAIGVMGIYAVLWQQILKRIELSTAYMFKGTSLVFVLIFSVLLFGEGISLWNIIGSCIIITGITMFALVDRKEAQL